MKLSWYEILDVSETASEEQIKEAYKTLCVKWHPDKNKGNKMAEEMFKQINGAYEEGMKFRKSKTEYKTSQNSKSTYQKTSTASPKEPLKKQYDNSGWGWLFVGIFVLVCVAAATSKNNTKQNNGWVGPKSDSVVTDHNVSEQIEVTHRESKKVDGYYTYPAIQEGWVQESYSFSWRAKNNATIGHFNGGTWVETPYDADISWEIRIYDMNGTDIIDKAIFFTDTNCNYIPAKESRYCNVSTYFPNLPNRWRYSIVPNATARG